MDVSKIHAKELERIKKNVRNSYDYFEPNYNRFNEFRRFVFDSSLNSDDRTILRELKKPEIEFNICESYISRLRGEFSKQQPSIIVTADDGAKVSSEVIDLVKNHLKHILFDANRNSCEYNVYTDILSGGFSAVKIWTEYAHSMSFNQVIKFDRVYDPTLVGFDPLARLPHKGDGRWCFELFPKARDEFEQEYPDINLHGMDFTRTLEGFNWCYSENEEDVLLLCDYYEKKKRKKRIVELVNGYTMSVSDYEKFVFHWNEAGIIEQVPAIRGEPRWTEIETICRYQLIGNKVIDYTETNYPALPIVFVDGNSILIRDGSNQGSFLQMTRPYVYHLKGLQQLKNFAGQTLANELENLVQHKFKVAKESLPDEQAYLDAYTNIQLANTLVYKAFKDNDPKVPVPPPMEIQRVPPPQEVISTFTLVDQMAQSILGSYDASLGINDNQLSGIAIVEGATQSNAAAMPYIVGFLQAFSQIANIVVQLIPKYYVTPRTIPIVDEDGQKAYKKINEPGQMYMNYDDNALSVKVEAGVNFAIQKSRTLQQIIAMSQAMPVFGQFMNAKGLKVLIENLEIGSADQLKELAEQFMQEMQKQQQMQQQQQQEAMKNNPMTIKAHNETMKIQLDAKQDQVENQIKAAKIAVDKQEADTNFLKVLADMQSSKVELQAAESRAQAEETRAAVDLAIKHADMQHKHRINEKELDHTIKESHKERAKE